MKVIAKGFGAKFRKEAGILVAHHRDARRRGDHDRLGVAIDSHKTLCLRKGLSSKAGVGVHLSAAGLRGVEIKLNAKPLQQPNHGTPGLWEESVVVAGDEERCPHRNAPVKIADWLESKGYAMRRH